MSKRFRIDFTVRELDVPAEDARGISFGDDVPVEQIVDFFDRCRDAARTLFVQAPPVAKKPSDVVAAGVSRGIDINDEIEQARMKRIQFEHVRARHERSIKPFPGDDGTRGGDGPMSEEAKIWFAQQTDPSHDQR